MLHVNRYRGYNLADINGQRLAEAVAHAFFFPFASPPASSSGADSDAGSDHDSQHSLDDRAPRVFRTRDFDAIVAATKAATRTSLIALIRGEQCTPEESMCLQAAPSGPSGPSACGRARCAPSATTRIPARCFASSRSTLLGCSRCHLGALGKHLPGSSVSIQRLSFF